MLEDLPPDVVQVIITFLPTASSIINLALTSRKLHTTISVDDSTVWRSFVWARFPTIKSQGPWRSAAIQLTGRSRAWDRRSLVARECWAPLDQTRGVPGNNAAEKFGYVPAIDSYENENRQQVLAWGAAGRIMIRTSDNASLNWNVLKFQDDHVAMNDILDLRILRPNQRKSERQETVIFRRANGEITTLSTSGPQSCKVDARYALDDPIVDCMDVSGARHPLLATCNSEAIRLYHVHSKDKRVNATAVIKLEQDFHLQHRVRAVQFLSEKSIAIGMQRKDGRERAPLMVFDLNRQRPGSDCMAAASIINTSDTVINNTGIDTSETSLNTCNSTPKGRQSANVIRPLDKIAGNDGKLFLSGWTDGVVRLCDTRSPEGVVSTYHDAVDDGQILSILPVGHEKFLAGSHQNAVLKAFDMRMPGAISYSYPSYRSSVVESRREVNIFLSVKLPQRRQLWQPLPNQSDTNRTSRNLSRYRGSVYSLSAPTPSSSTVFAGIENHVLQLDFVCTDDLRRGFAEAIPPLSKTPPERILNLSAYERPRKNQESTDPVLLRKQVEWQTALSAQPPDTDNGWDQRWQLQTSERNSRRRGSWTAWRHW